MDNPTVELSIQLIAALRPFDERVLADALRVAALCRQNLTEFKASPECAAMRGDTWGKHARMASIAGGKGALAAIVVGRHDEYINKNHAARVEKRNALLIGKLQKLGITELAEQVQADSPDGTGFNGEYRVSTNQGNKRIMVKTVFAGGYHIQCAHLRVLVNVKDVR